MEGLGLANQQMAFFPKEAEERFLFVVKAAQRGA